MNESWYLFYGRRLNMSRREVLCTKYGEMLDMIACLAIQNGAPAKQEKRKMSFEQAMELR